MRDDELFAALGFGWDRGSAQRPVTATSVREALAAFDRDMAGHVWAAAALEGNPFTYPEVQTLLEGITVGGRKVSDADQVLRLRDAYVLLRNLVSEGEFALTKATSDTLHEVVARNEALEIGHFRGEGAVLSPVAVNLGELGTHVPPATEPGGDNLRSIHDRGLAALACIDHPFEKAAAYFLFAADNQFYFDGNKRTARSMMNGVLMTAGINAVLVPAQERQAFNEAMVHFYVGRDATAIMDLLGGSGPRREETEKRQARINRRLRTSDGPDRLEI